MSSTPPTPSPETPPVAAPAAEAMTPAACATQLRQLFPALFGSTAKPLKLRIQADIQERVPGVFTKQVLSAFLRRHTGSHAYLVALTKATHRYDLDGQPGDELSDEHRKVAQEELARRRANHEGKIALEQAQRRNRATLLRDFQQTTLTQANFCALKGVPVEELDGLLALARKEAEEQAQRPARPDHPNRNERNDRGERRPANGPRRR